MAGDEIPFDRSLDARAEALTQLSPLVRRLIANNGGPFTFTGTCSYIVGHKDVLVIDPGPADVPHHDALVTALDGCTVRGILVTHSHRDHALGAAMLKAVTGAPVLGPPPMMRLPVSAIAAQAMDASHDPSYAPDVILTEGNPVSCDACTLTTIETPGHTRHHLCFSHPAEAALFSGDHVMAWSTTVVAPPHGSMRAYMASLEKLLGRPETVYWPGHGGPVRNPQRFVRALIHHRRQRERAILSRVQAGNATVEGIVRDVYKDLSPALRGAAGLSVLAHLEDLQDRGLVRSEGQSGLYMPA